MGPHDTPLCCRKPNRSPKIRDKPLNPKWGPNDTNSGKKAFLALIGTAAYHHAYSSSGGRSRRAL